MSSELVEQLTKEKDESEARAVEAEAQFITIATLQKVLEICGVPGVAVGSQKGRSEEVKGCYPLNRPLLPFRRYGHAGSGMPNA